MATREELQSLRGRVEQLSEEHVYSPATSFTSLLAILSEVLDHLIQERDMPAGLVNHRLATEASVEHSGLKINLPDESQDESNDVSPDSFLDFIH